MTRTDLSTGSFILRKAEIMVDEIPIDQVFIDCVTMLHRNKAVEYCYYTSNESYECFLIGTTISIMSSVLKMFNLLTE